MYEDTTATVELDVRKRSGSRSCAKTSYSGIGRCPTTSRPSRALRRWPRVRCCTKRADRLRSRCACSRVSMDGQRVVVALSRRLERTWVGSPQGCSSRRLAPRPLGFTAGEVGCIVFSPASCVAERCGARCGGRLSLLRTSRSFLLLVGRLGTASRLGRDRLALRHRLLLRRLLGGDQTDGDEVERADETIGDPEAVGAGDGVAQRNRPMMLDQDQRDGLRPD